MRKRMTKLEDAHAANENEDCVFEYRSKRYLISYREGRGWAVYHTITYCEWADDIAIHNLPPGPIDGKYYATKEELLQQCTIDGRSLMDILAHYEEDYGTEKNPRPPHKLTYERLKKVPDRWVIGRIEIQIANRRWVERPEYKVTPHDYYDDPFWIEIEWEYHDEQGNRLYSLTVRKYYEAEIFKLEDLHADEFWNILGHMTIYDKTFEEHCNNQENNDRVQIFIRS